MMDRTIACQRAAELVDQMTLEEKASQLRYDAPAIERLGIPAYNWWNEALHGVARAGTATVFPQAIGLAAMFDDVFLQKIADSIATEGRAKYNAQSANGDRDIYKGLTFWSPNVNIFRDPRWGRGHETYGEDPYLSSKLGVAFVKGLQGTGKYLKSAACAKHYAVHSGPEKNRHSFNAIVSKKDMAETYLPAFEALVKEGKVEAVMGAYNRVNGEPACGSETLLIDILRKHWGFEGHVVSDCWAIRDFHTHHMITDTAPQSAALAIKNGCDLNCGNTYLHLLQAVREGLITEEDIALSAKRVITSRILMGLMDFDSEYNQIDYSMNDTDENNALALDAAQKSMVLLKNDGLLPLDMNSIKTIAVIGPNANSIPALEGNYNGTSSRYVTFLEGIREAARGKARVIYSEGCHLYKDRMSNLSMADDRLSEAAACAEMADVTILCLGLDATLEGEEGDTGNEYYSGDKSDLELPKSQQRLLQRVLDTGKPVIAVVAAGSALRVEEGNAIIMAWYAGQAGGTALADIIFGKVSPSGKLPITFYHSINDLPGFCDYAMKNRTYRYYEGEALYPFGFGLSYGDIKIEKASLRRCSNSIEIKAIVSNKGMDTEDVLQVYVKKEGDINAPLHPALAGFIRISLKKDELKEIALPLDKEAFTVVNKDGERLAPEGQYAIYVGMSQPDAKSILLTEKQPQIFSFEW